MHFPAFVPLAGEHYQLLLRSGAESSDAVAMVYFNGGNAKDIIVRPCTLALSQYRLLLGPAGAREAMAMPLMSIADWVVEPGSTALATALLEARQQDPRRTKPVAAISSALKLVTLRTKHVWTVRFLVQNEMVLRNIKLTLSRCRRLGRLEQLPAFEYHRARERDVQGEGQSSPAAAADHTEIDFGWWLYNPRRELERQLCCEPSVVPVVTPAALSAGRVGVGCDLRPWFYFVELPRLASGYTSSPTYPAALVEPATVSSALVLRAMDARMRARLPAVSYVHLGTGAVLARCAQPSMGSSALSADAQLCFALTNTGYTTHNTRVSQDPQPQAPAAASAYVPPPSLFTEDDDGGGVAAPRRPPSMPAVLQVMDCRPYAVALTNRMRGGGFESGALYDFCRVRFCEIDNIFGVVESFNRLRAALRDYEGDAPVEGFLKSLHDSKWLQNIQRILVCADAVACHLDVHGESCLVHCTDGWDRTSQCCAAAMLLLDPFYRTIVGFIILLEKEFLAFGHPFAMRHGHQVPGRTSSVTAARDAHPESERPVPAEFSPVFLQFMDAVYQLLRQFSTAFEFTPHLLASISTAVHSCLYGTFLGNSSQERVLEGLPLQTASVWTDVLRRVQQEKDGEVPLCYVNRHYDAATAWHHIRRRQQPDGASEPPAASSDERALPPTCGTQRLIPSCSSKRLVFWEQLYLKYDPDNYHPRSDPHSLHHGNGDAGQRRRIRWGGGLDEYLARYVTDACAARLAEVPALEKAEAHVAAAARARPELGAKQKSAWCVPSSSSCFGCDNVFGLLTPKVTCSGCQEVFCLNCVYRADRCRTCGGEGMM